MSGRYCGSQERVNVEAPISSQARDQFGSIVFDFATLLAACWLGFVCASASHLFHLFCFCRAEVQTLELLNSSVGFAGLSSNSICGDC